MKWCLLISGFNLFIQLCWIAQERTASGCGRYRRLICGMSVVKLRFTYRWEREEGEWEKELGAVTGRDLGKYRFSITFQNDNFNSKKRQVTQAIPIKNFSVRKANISNHLHHQSIGSQVKPTTCSDITGVINAAAA